MFLSALFHSFPPPNDSRQIWFVAFCFVFVRYLFCIARTVSFYEAPPLTTPPTQVSFSSIGTILLDFFLLTNSLSPHHFVDSVPFFLSMMPSPGLSFPPTPTLTKLPSQILLHYRFVALFSPSAALNWAKEYHLQWLQPGPPLPFLAKRFRPVARFLTSKTFFSSRNSELTPRKRFPRPLLQSGPFPLFPLFRRNPLRFFFDSRRQDLFRNIFPWVTFVNGWLGFPSLHFFAWRPRFQFSFPMLFFPCE